MRNKLLLCCSALVLVLSSCKKADEEPAVEDPVAAAPAPTPTVAPQGSYLRWEEIADDDRYNANYFANGKVYHSPYVFSENYGSSWTVLPSDGMNRQFERFGNNFAEVKSVAGTVVQYTMMNGGAVLSYSASPNQVGWDGSPKAYVWDGNSLYRTTNGGTSWSTATLPPKRAQFVAFSDLELAGNSLYVVQQYLEMPGNFTRYIIQVSSDEGATWKESDSYSVAISVTAFNTNEVLARIGSSSTSVQGVFKVSVGSSVSLTAFDFENGTNSEVQKILRIGPENYAFGYTYSGIKVKHPTNGKYFSASTKPSGFSSGVVCDNYLIVTMNRTLYRTPFPLVFHDTP